MCPLLARSPPGLAGLISTLPRCRVSRSTVRVLLVSTARFLADLSLGSDALFDSEFLIHAADVEGLCQGIDEELVESASRLVSPSILVS